MFMKEFGRAPKSQKELALFAESKGTILLDPASPATKVPEAPPAAGGFTRENLDAYLKSGNRPQPDPGLVAPAAPARQGMSPYLKYGVPGAGLLAALTALGLAGGDDEPAGPAVSGVRQQFGENALAPYSELGPEGPASSAPSLKRNLVNRKLKGRGPSIGEQELIDQSKESITQAAVNQNSAQGFVPIMPDAELRKLFQTGPYDPRGNR
jgi:hypothetical protein